VFYDGPLVPSFANNFEPEVRDRYRETMARALAASKRHAVPVVGYTTGSERASLARLLRRIDDGLTSEPLVTDGRIVEGLADNWGDRSPLFVNRTIDADIDAGSGLAATYAGREYEFGDRVLFTYLDGGDTTDRVEVPRWVLDADLAEHVLDVVRAEAAVGRGYPELLQQADANAVLGAGAKREFLALVQRFAEEHDLPVDWNRKALSKQRRRR
jgi:hypothetical protein